MMGIEKIQVPRDELIRMEFSVQQLSNSIKEIRAALEGECMKTIHDNLQLPRNVNFEEYFYNYFGKFDSSEGLNIPIGRDACENDVFFHCGGVNSSFLVEGQSGYGKTTLLNSIIIGAAMLYSPSQLELWLVDYSKVGEFKIYGNLPHVKSEFTTISSDKILIDDVCDKILSEIDTRAEYISSHNGNGMYATCFEKIRENGIALPRILFVVNDYDSRPDVNRNDDKLEKILTLGRKLGISVVLSYTNRNNISINKDLFSACYGFRGAHGYHFDFEEMTNCLNVGNIVYNKKNKDFVTFMGAKVKEPINMVNIVQCNNIKQFKH